MRFFGKNPVKKASESVLSLLEGAALQLNPRRAFDELDLALDASPRLSSLNQLLGREGQDRFLPISTTDLVSAARRFQSRGLSDQVANLIQSAGVARPEMALMAAALHVAASDQVRPDRPCGRPNRARSLAA